MGPGLRPGAIQPRRLAAVRRRRNPLLIFALRKSTKIKNKSAPADAQFSGKTVLSDGLSFLFVLIETRVGHRVSKENFEPAGSTRFHLDGLKGLVP